MNDLYPRFAEIIEQTNPLSPQRRAKMLYTYLKEKSGEHALQLVEILHSEHHPDKRETKIQVALGRRIAPQIAPWITDDPEGEFLSFYLRHLSGRIHGAGVPLKATEVVVEFVGRYIRTEIAVMETHRSRPTL